MLRSIDRRFDEDLQQQHNNNNNEDDETCTDGSSLTRDEFIEIMLPKVRARDPEVELRRTFDLFDEDGVGYITFRNLKSIAKDCFKGGNGSEGIPYSDDELQEMLDEADRDGDGVLNREEFYRVMRMKNASPLDLLSSDEEEEEEENNDGGEKRG